MKKILPLFLLFICLSRYSQAQTVIYTEGFNSAIIPAGWTIYDVVPKYGQITFETASGYPPGKTPTEGTRMAMFKYSEDAKIRLQQATPFSSAGRTGIKVNFDWLNSPSSSFSGCDSVYVQWSLDGTTWNTAGGVARIGGKNSQWTARSFALPAEADNQATLYIGFLYVSKYYGTYCYVDNVKVTADVSANGLVVSEWISPVNGSDPNSDSFVKIKVTNSSATDVSNFNVSYSIDGGATFVTENIAGTLSPGASAVYTFTTKADMSTIKTYNCLAAAYLSGDPADNVTLNTHITIDKILYFQGFNDATVPAGWSVDPMGTTGSVYFGYSSSNPSGYVPTEGLRMAELRGANWLDKVRLAQVIPFSSSGHQNVTVQFDWLKTNANPSYPDSLYVQWSTDGTNWNTVGKIGRYGTATEWTTQSFSLPAEADNQATLYIGVFFIARIGGYGHLDNLSVKADAMIPNDLSVTKWVSPFNRSDTCSSDVVKIEVTNMGTADASNFDICYSIDGGAHFTTQNIPGTVSAGASAVYRFATYANMSMYKTYHCIAAINYNKDQNHYNDTLKTDITTDSLLYSQGFNDTFIPDDWTVTGGSTGYIAFVPSSNYPQGFTPTEGTRLVEFANYGWGEKVRLGQKIPITTSGYRNVKVKFDWGQDGGRVSALDSIYLQWSTDGITWNNSGGEGRYAPVSSKWKSLSFTLPAGAENQEKLYLGFLFVSKSGNWGHLDNIKVKAERILLDDLSVTGWAEPLNGSDTCSQSVVKVKVNNDGLNDVSNFTLSYSVDGGAHFITQNVTGTLSSLTSQIYTFTTKADLSIYKNYNCITAVHLTGDQNTKNDTLKTTILTMQPIQTETCYPQSLPLWSGTVKTDQIIDDSYVEAAFVNSSTGWVKFDISSIPDNAHVSNIELHSYVRYGNWEHLKLMSLEHDPVTSTPDIIFSDTRDGNIYNKVTEYFPNAGSYAINLNTSATNDFTGKLADNWFGIGVWNYEANFYPTRLDGWKEPNKPYIVVKYKKGFDIDVAVEAITSPVSGKNPGNQVTIRIKNYGTNPVTQIPVSYEFDGSTVTEITPAGVILNLWDEYTYTFTQTITIPERGAKELVCYHSYPGDINTYNDRVTYPVERFYPLALKINTEALTGSSGAFYKNGNYYVFAETDNIFKLDNKGTLVSTISFPAFGLVDVTADANYIYGCNGSAMIYRYDMPNSTVDYLSNFAPSVQLDGCEYDPAKDALWVNSASERNISLINKTSCDIIQTVANPNPALYSFKGLAYDNWTPGGPYIVGFSLHKNKNQLVWIKISDGSVWVDHDVTQEIPEAIASNKVAGGTFTSKEAISGSVMIGGVIRQLRLFGFEIASTSISSYAFPGQASSSVDSVKKEIQVNFPFNAQLSGLSPIFTLADYHGLAKAYSNSNLQISGVNSFNLSNGDILPYHVVRKNVDNTDSIYTDWKVIINVLDTPVFKTIASTDVSFTTATFNGTIMPNEVPISNVHFEYGLTTSYGSTISPVKTIANGSIAVPFTAMASGLNANTTYHYRLVGMVGSSYFYGNDMIFSTYEYPVLTTGEASVTLTKADLEGFVNAKSQNVEKIGFLFGEASGVYTDTIKGTPALTTGTTPVHITASLSGLTKDKTYYYKLIGKVGALYFYGDEMTFSTLDSPLLTTLPASNITLTTADLAATLNAKGNNVKNIRFLIGTTSGIYTDTIAASSSTEHGNIPVSVTGSVSGLTGGSTYYYKLMGKVGGLYVYGNEVTFTTLASPVLTTGAANNITFVFADVLGSVNANGNNVEDIGFLIGTTSNVYTDTVTAIPAAENGTVTVNLSASLSNLSGSTTYYYKLMGRVGIVYFYGTEATFTTQPSPVLTTGAASNTTFAMADLSGSIIPNSYYVYDVGFQIGTSSGVYNDFIAGTPDFNDGTASGNISASLSGLNSGSMYYYRLKGTAMGVLVYGNEMTFSTIASPILTTGSASNITFTTADLTGIINANGNNVEKIGFLLGTTSGIYTDTIAGTPATENGSVPVDIAASLSGLTVNTTYYYKSVGKVASLYIYGNEMTFSTFGMIDQSIAFDALTTKTYGDEPFTISATGGASGNPVIFSSSDNQVATCTGVNGTTITILNAGTCTIYANQDGSAHYNAASQVSQTLTVNPKNITVSSIIPASEIYDGNADFIINGGTLDGVISGDTVMLDPNSAIFSDKNAGTGKSLIAAIFTLSGADAGNYTLTQPIGLKADIIKASLVIGITAENKNYDGNTNATVTASVINGLIAGDIVTANANNARFDNPNAGNGKTVTADIFISGIDTINYFYNTTAYTTADIIADNTIPVVTFPILPDNTSLKITTPIQISFSKKVNMVSANVQDAIILREGDVNGKDVSFICDTFTPNNISQITIMANFKCSQSYYVAVKAGSFTDPVGNAVELTEKTFITISGMAKPLLTGSENILCPGDTLAISNYNSTLLYRWLINGIVIGWQGGNKYMTPSDEAGVYSILVESSETGCTNVSENYLVQIHPIVPLLIHEKHEHGGPVSLLIVNNVHQMFTSYTWTYANGNALPATIINNRQYLVLTGADLNGKYQVKVTDKNGCKVESSAITPTIKEASAMVYPTLNKGNFTVGLIHPDNGEVAVKIYNQSGVIIEQYLFNKTSREGAFQINMDTINSGPYMVEVSINGYKEVKWIVVEQ